MGRTEDGLEQIVNGEEQPGTSQFHVLAVDDSIVDRKVIERLLKISAYKGNFDSAHQWPQFFSV